MGDDWDPQPRYVHRMSADVPLNLPQLGLMPYTQPADYSTGCRKLCRVSPAEKRLIRQFTCRAIQEEEVGKKYPRKNRTTTLFHDPKPACRAERKEQSENSPHA